MPKTKPIPLLTPEQIARFWSKVDRRGIDDCWEWQGQTNGKRGYGQVRIREAHFLAHRIAFSLAHGDPGDLHVCHKCDNPRCCNPNHHFTGRNIDNVMDMHAKGRGVYGEDHHNTTLTSSDVRAIRASNLSQHTLAREYGVTQGTIHNIKASKTWKNLTQREANALGI